MILIFVAEFVKKKFLTQDGNFVDFEESGSAWFYDLESISTSHDIVPLWMKQIYSERKRQDVIKNVGKDVKI